MNKSTEKIKKEDYGYIGQWKQPILSASFWINWTSSGAFETLGVTGFKGDMMLLDGHFFYWENDLRRLKELMVVNAKGPKRDFFEKFEKVANKSSVKHTHNTKLLASNHASLEDFFSTMHDIYALWTIAFVGADMIIEPLKRRGAQSGMTEQELALYVSAEKPTETEKAVRRSREIALELKKAKLLKTITPQRGEESLLIIRKKQPKIAQMIDRYMSKFSWLGTHHFWGTPLTLSRFFEEIKADKKTSQRKNILELPEDLQEIIHWVRVFTYWRQYLAEITDFTVYDVNKQLADSARMLGLNYNQYIWLTDLEILKNKKIKIDEIRKRKEKSGVCGMSGGLEVITGSVISKLIDKLLKVPGKRVFELKGTVASKGIVEGNVRVVLAPEDGKNFKKGEVLVAPETSPDFVPFMRLSSAVITDRGGLTSHAAIISRELGIPCVIGTQTATQILKTGEKVLVDAERGIIKRVK